MLKPALLAAAILLLAAPAFADDLSDCVDHPPSKPVTTTTVRSTLLRKIDLYGLPGVRAGACIDSPLGTIAGARLGVFASNGQLLANYGQGVNPGINAKQHGTVWSYFFNEDRVTLGYDPARITDWMLVQPLFADNTTGNLFHRVTTADLPLKPLGRIDPGTCLSPPHPTEPELRDVSTLTYTKTYGIDACLAAPANAAMSAASANFHIFAKAEPTNPHSTLLEVAKAGNGENGLQPLIGVPHHLKLPKTIALLGVGSTATGQPMEGSRPIPLAIVERQATLCRVAKGAPCTPVDVNDLVAVPLINRGTNPP